MKKFVAYIISHFPKFWKFISNVPFISKRLNRLAINSIVNSTDPRPHPFSLWSPEDVPLPKNTLNYTSWVSLTNRKYTARQLGPENINKLYPDIDKVTSLFRRDKPNLKSERSSVLFAFFAQWFTDSFLRTDPNDFRKNTSNHEIDLCQIYGLDEFTTNILRDKSKGKLKYQEINGAVYPPYLFAEDGEIKEEFRELHYLDQLESIYKALDLDSEERKFIFVSGLERGNTTVGYSALNTLFLREHNRVCDELNKFHPDWNDEQLFQTARNILIVILLKIIVQDYVNHISPAYFPFQVEVGFPENQRWYRGNWINVEFGLLYRWHSLVPDEVMLNNESYEPTKFMLNNKPLIDLGLGKVINDLSNQHAYKPGLFNSPDFLLFAEKSTIEQGRESMLKSYNDYREAYSQGRFKDFSELTSNLDVRKKLEEIYDDIDDVEFWVGIFAEDPSNRALFGDLMTVMVGADAFSQALTNPLLSKYVFNENTFSKTGMKIISESNSLQDVVLRNIKNPDATMVSFDI